MKLHYYKKSGIIQVKEGRRTYTFPPDKREEAYAFILRRFGRHLGSHLVGELKKCMDN